MRKLFIKIFLITQNCAHINAEIILKCTLSLLRMTQKVKVSFLYSYIISELLKIFFQIIYTTCSTLILINPIYYSISIYYTVFTYIIQHEEEKDV